MWTLETVQMAVYRQRDPRSTADARQKPGARSRDRQVLSVALGSAVMLSQRGVPS